MKLHGDDTRVLAMGLGALTGVRSMAGIALLTNQGADGLPPPRGMAYLGDTGLGRVALALAAGETLADKVPGIPARTHPLPLAGRALFGGLAGALVAALTREERRLGPAVIGAAAAVASAIGATRVRALISGRTPIPSAVLGMAEDALVLAGSAWLATRLADRRDAIRTARDTGGHPRLLADAGRAPGMHGRAPDGETGLADTDAMEYGSRPVPGMDAPPPGPPMVDEIIDETFPASDPAPWWGGTAEPIDRAYGDPDSEDDEFGEPGRSEIT